MEDWQMHDWSVLNIEFDWVRGRVSIVMSDDSSRRRVVVADNVHELFAPQHNEWGESECINVTDGPNDIQGGLRIMEFEMQSGDRIKIIARHFAGP